jgi:hypothetical protein
MNEELETEMPKRGPGRPRKADAVEHDAYIGEDGFDEYVWCPGEGDSAVTKWNGFTFKAGTPTKISKNKTVKQLITQKYRQQDGTFITRGVELEVLMRDVVKTNPRFSLNGAPPAEQKALGQPTTPEEYKNHANKWIMMASSAAFLDARWNNEEMLREQCGVEGKEIAEIMSIFEMRHKILSAFA